MKTHLKHFFIVFFRFSLRSIIVLFFDTQQLVMSVTPVLSRRCRKIRSFSLYLLFLPVRLFGYYNTLDWQTRYKYFITLVTTTYIWLCSAFITCVSFVPVRIKLLFLFKCACFPFWLKRNAIYKSFYYFIFTWASLKNLYFSTIITIIYF